MLPIAHAFGILALDRVYLFNLLALIFSFFFASAWLLLLHHQSTKCLYLFNTKNQLRSLIAANFLFKHFCGRETTE
jgi:hypothetical protein